MKLRKIFLFSLAISFICSLKAQTSFTYKTYGNVANYFADPNEMLQFFELKNGDVVAEIGANDGQNIGGFSLLIDSCIFYIEDINPQALNEKKWNKVYKKCKNLGMSSRHQFNIVIGNEKASLLPATSFDKIIMVSAFHEFAYMDEMIDDIISKLKPNGKIYILETHCYTSTHTNYSMEQTISLMEKHGMHLLKTDQTQQNGSEGLYKLAFGK